MTILVYAVVVWVFAIGIYGAIISRSLIHLALCLTVTQSSTYILLLTIGYRHGAGAPIFGSATWVDLSGASGAHASMSP